MGRRTPRSAPSRCPVPRRPELGLDVGRLLRSSLFPMPLSDEPNHAVIPAKAGTHVRFIGSVGLKREALNRQCSRLAETPADRRRGWPPGPSAMLAHRVGAAMTMMGSSFFQDKKRGVRGTRAPYGRSQALVGQGAGPSPVRAATRCLQPLRPAQLPARAVDDWTGRLLVGNRKPK